MYAYIKKCQSVYEINRNTRNIIINLAMVYFIAINSVKGQIRLVNLFIKKRLTF